jgi:outer membrane receptor protein involved in Fe transport
LTFEITPEIEFFAEGTYFRSQADELVQQPTFNSSLFGGNSAALNFSVNNPLLTDQARNALIARGVTTFQVSRASLDLADLTGANETEIYRGVVGIRGDFNLFSRDFNFELSYNHGETESRDTGQDVNAQNFNNAVNVTRNAAGQIVCTTAQTRTGGNGFAAGTPIADPACVPLDIFGEGRSSQAARDYVISENTAVSRNEQTVINANIGGSFFDIWGGAVAFNAGYEYRKEEGSFTPSEFQRLGLGRSVAIAGIAGEYELNEVFGELLVPIVSPETGLDWLYGLQVFGRGRYVDNSLAGGFFSYAVGGSFAPIQDIEFRGNFTRSFRSPAIQELFQPVVPAFSTVPDLCSVANRNAGPVPTVRAANCAAFLARFPNATPDPAGTATVPILSGGNPNLENEKADSYTFGVILRPSFIPRLSITADWISITIKDPIGTLSVAGIAGGCFDNTQFDTSDPANGNSFCSRIRRDANGRVVNDPANPAVQAGFINGQEIRFRGLQTTLDYRVPNILGLPGTFTVGADALYVHRRLNNFTGVAPARSDGTIGDPELSGQVRLRYVEDQWGINTTVNYVHEQVFSRFNRESGQPGQGLDAREFDKLDPYAIVSGSIFFDPTEDFRITFAVTNAFNHVGQEYFGIIIPASQVDLLGRRYSVSGRIRF